MDDIIQDILEQICIQIKGEPKERRNLAQLARTCKTRTAIVEFSTISEAAATYTY